MGNVAFTSRTKNPQFEGVFDIAPDELSKLSMDTVKVIDVREPDEYIGELGHINESELVVLRTLPDRIVALPKDKPIVFVCKSGGRSAQATAFAQANGFNQVYNMKGGMLLWNSLGLPVVK
jgi:rhodanese-related sulfurtransferase